MTGRDGVTKPVVHRLVNSILQAIAGPGCGQSWQGQVAQEWVQTRSGTT